MVMYPPVIIPGAAYAMAFSLSNVLTTVEVPQLLLEKFGLNTEQLGLDFNFSASVGVFIIITFVQQIWGFLGPSWFPPMFENVVVAASSGVGCALIVGVRVIPTLILHFMGRAWRPAIE
ncbi:uncharacterized protein ATNIH1004_010396 [Aspergillus tanneri]|uniref:Major facilitator superfamily (MFS) profile domain-containing protein n=1 Tax=Aspergillus tanneri TaxID=1220188 RepID=A0A5M9MLH8_9EURO|nr:uncharacterized protein ATNIH1004_010396 [Aspergillus tanneri]KAA8643627.1 hypothetical protein ATNIH1004_010396 [Aspergillus tanneri]